MLDDHEVAAELQENYRYSHDYWAPFVKNARVYTLAAAGSTWSRAELEQLSKEGREPIEFNIMRRPLEFYSGYLRDNLNSVVVAPVEGSDQLTADQFTKLQYDRWEKGRGYNTFLDACDESFKAGISLAGIYMDYSQDFINGDISFFKRTYNAFYLDPNFERIDLSDCAFTIMRDILDKGVVKRVLPFIDPQVIDEIHTGFRDDKFLSYHPQFTTLSRKRNVMSYDQYYRRTSRPRTFLIDEEGGVYKDVTDLDEDQMKLLKRGIKRVEDLYREAETGGVQAKDLPVRLALKEVERDYIELNILLNGQRVYTGEDKTGLTENYPFAPIVCYMEPSIWEPSLRIQGIAATEYSNQRQFNKRHMKIIDMMDSEISTGFKYLIGSVPDPSELQQSGQSRLIGVSSDPNKAPQGLASVEQLKGGGTNPSLIEYQSILDKLSLTFANINESVLGIDEKGNNQVSGRLAEVRIAQGLRSNRKVFDKIEESQLQLGRLVLKAIQNNYPPSKVKRIIGEEPTQQFYDKEFEHYDAVLKEGVRSKSQRDAYYNELVNLKREGIVDVPQSEIISILPTVGASDLQKAIEEQDQKQQAQQQIQDEIQRKQIEVLEATAAEKQGLAGERESRQLSNIGLLKERASESEQNIAQAALDRARAIEEISKIREDRLIQALNVVNSLKQEEEVGRDREEAQAESQANEIEEGIEGTAANKTKNAKQEIEQILSNGL